MWALVLATPVAAFSQSNADASVCLQGNGPACGASRLAGHSAGPDTAARRGIAVTDPAALVILGTGLVSLGLWTRRMLPRREPSSSG